MSQDNPNWMTFHYDRYKKDNCTPVKKVSVSANNFDN